MPIRKIVKIDEQKCNGCGQCIVNCPEGALAIVDGKARVVKESYCDGLGACIGTCPVDAITLEQRDADPFDEAAGSPSQLRQWPIQLELVRPDAPFLQNADLLLVAGCVPFALADFHQRFLRDRAVVVGCPKLNDADAYYAKLVNVFAQSAPRSLTILRMEVPCCSGLCRITEKALEASGRKFPVRDVTIGIDGSILAEQTWD
jgi:Pyruvate/2-oxoacid:ferredoxin oxidoreductase delta subunit